MDVPQDHCVHFLQVRNSLSGASPQPEDFEVWIVHRSLCKFCCCRDAMRPDEVNGGEACVADWNKTKCSQLKLPDIQKVGKSNPRYKSHLSALHGGEHVSDPTSGHETSSAQHPHEPTDAPPLSQAVKASQENPPKQEKIASQRRNDADYEMMLHVRRKKAQMLAEGSDTLALLTLYKKFDIDLNVIQDLKDAFDAFDESQDGLLTKSQFTDLLRTELTFNGDDIPDDLVGDRWFKPKSIKDNTQTVDFEDFVLWYQAHRFEEVMLVSDEARLVRRVARSHNLPVGVVLCIHQSFHEIAQKPSQKLRFPEFCKLLCKLLHTQKEQMSEDMLRNLWSEAVAELDSLDFEMFLLWYLRHFGEIKGSADAANSVLQEYFKSLRPSYTSP